MPILSFHDYRLFKVWALLSPKESKKLENWLEGPWPKYNNSILWLYRILRPSYPEFRFGDQEKEKILRAMLSEKKMDTERLPTLMSQLSKEIEHFLVHEKIAKDATLQEEILLQELDKRGEVAWAANRRDRLIQRLKAKEAKGWHDLTKLSLLYENQHRSSAKSQINAATMEAVDLLQADYYLDLSYTLCKYRFLLEFVEREKILEVDYQLDQKIAKLICIWSRSQLSRF